MIYEVQVTTTLKVRAKSEAAAHGIAEFKLRDALAMYANRTREDDGIISGRIELQETLHCLEF